jgi:hypothetical protein
MEYQYFVCNMTGQENLEIMLARSGCTVFLRVYSICKITPFGVELKLPNKKHCWHIFV